MSCYEDYMSKYMENFWEEYIACSKFTLSIGYY